MSAKGALARSLSSGFYSALEEAVPQLQKKLTGEQALSQLSKLGVKVEDG